eukprot:11733037-Alexandrium_andersonii.AAC.1
MYLPHTVDERAMRAHGSVSLANASHSGVAPVRDWPQTDGGGCAVIESSTCTSALLQQLV